MRHDEAIHDRIAADGEHDRDRRGHRLGRLHSECAVHAGNDRDLTVHEVCRESRQPIVLQFGKAEFDRHIAAFDKAGLAQALAKPTHTIPVRIKR